MQAQLCYYGRFGDMMYLENLPWDRFMYFYEWLKSTKKKEYEEREKASKQQAAAMEAAKSRSHTASRRRRF